VGECQRAVEYREGWQRPGKSLAGIFDEALLRRPELVEARWVRMDGGGFFRGEEAGSEPLCFVRIPRTDALDVRADRTVGYGGEAHPLRMGDADVNGSGFKIRLAAAVMDEAAVDAEGILCCVYGEPPSGVMLALFGAGGEADAPTVEMAEEDFYIEGKTDILTMLVRSGLCKSKSEARQAVQQGGVSVDGEKVADIKTYYAKEELANGKLIRKGKKTYMKVIFKA